MFEYDEDAAVKFIQNYLPQELKEKFTEDTICYMLDVLCDFYEKRNWECDDDLAKEEREMVQYFVDAVKADQIGEFTENEIRIFLSAEIAYADTVDIPV